jgi:hypothetical protein
MAPAPRCQGRLREFEFVFCSFALCAVVVVVASARLVCARARRPARVLAGWGAPRRPQASGTLHPALWLQASTPPTSRALPEELQGQGRRAPRRPQTPSPSPPPRLTRHVWRLCMFCVLPCPCTAPRPVCGHVRVRAFDDAQRTRWYIHTSYVIHLCYKLHFEL